MAEKIKTMVCLPLLVLSHQRPQQVAAGMAGSGPPPYLPSPCLSIPSQPLLRGLSRGLTTSRQGHFQPASQGRAGSSHGEAAWLWAPGWGEGPCTRAAG